MHGTFGEKEKEKEEKESEIMFAILDGKAVVPLEFSDENSLKWCIFMNEANRHVGLTGVRNDGTTFPIELVCYSEDEKNGRILPPYVWDLHEEIPYAVVSTIFLGVKMPHHCGWFESILKTGDEWGERRGSNAWDEAVKVHDEVVAEAITKVMNEKRHA